MSANEILIVGAGLGAFRCSQQLRQRGYRGSITVLGAEQHQPYDRPPLSKQVLRGERDSTTFAVTQPLDVNWVGGCRAVSLDTSSREVICGDGRVRIYDALILAPGGRPRMLPGVSRGAGVHVLRTIDDALAIRTSMNASKHIVVVGGGFIGCEIAASARRLGFEVDLIEGLALPLRGVLGPQAASRVTDLHKAQGVRMHLGAAVEEVVRDEAGNVCGVRISDGTFVAGRNVVVGIGIVPDVDWLVGTGIELGDGIRCDGNGRTSMPNVYALGDAAEWWHPLMKECRRIEHWTTTVDQAAVVAATIMAADSEDVPPLTDPPYFWSDQYDLKIQAMGFIHPDDDVDLVTVRDKPVLLYSRDSILRGVVGFSIPVAVMRSKPLVKRGAPLQEAIDMLTT